MIRLHPASAGVKQATPFSAEPALAGLFLHTLFQDFPSGSVSVVRFLVLNIVHNSFEVHSGKACHTIAALPFQGIFPEPDVHLMGAGAFEFLS